MADTEVSKCRTLQQDLELRNQGPWPIDESPDQVKNPAGSLIAAAMGRGDENDRLDAGTGSKNNASKFSWQWSWLWQPLPYAL